MISRFARWYDARPVAGDALLAGLLLVAFVLPSDLAEESDVAVGLAFSVALLACVPFRRRAPVGVFVAVSVLCLAQFAVLDRIVAGDVVALIALYTLVAYGPGTRIGRHRDGVRRRRRAARRRALGDLGDAVSGVEVAATTVISTLLAATLGAWRRSRRAQLAALESATACWRSSAISRRRSAPRSSAPGSPASCTTSSPTRCR